MIGQRPAHRGGVARFLVAQAKAGAERYRVGQQPQRVAGRAYLDRQQLAGERRGGVHLVNDRQPAGQSVGHQHALITSHQDRADPGPGRQQDSQPCGGLVVAQAGRHHRHHRSIAGLGISDGKRRPDIGPAPARGGDARGQHAQPAAGAARSGTVTTEVSTARSGASLASATTDPSWRSSRRTSAAAPRSEPADPLRPRVGTRPAPRISPPRTSTTSVVAFPTSTPAITVTRPPPLAGKASAGVDVRRLGHQRRTAGQAPGGQ